MSSTRIWFRVHGSVQGVNFRNFTKARADELGVSGWVQNSKESTERVEGEAQGESGSVSQLLKALDRGPTHAHVVKIEKGDMEEVGDEMGFQVLRRSAVRDVSHHRS